MNVNYYFFINFWFVKVNRNDKFGQQCVKIYVKRIFKKISSKAKKKKRSNNFFNLLIRFCNVSKKLKTNISNKIFIVNSSRLLFKFSIIENEKAIFRCFRIESIKNEKKNIKLICEWIWLIKRYVVIAFDVFCLIWKFAIERCDVNAFSYFKFKSFKNISMTFWNVNFNWILNDFEFDLLSCLKN